MSFLHQDNCCCIFSLTTGTKIIAVFTALSGITNLFDGISSIGSAEKYVYVIQIIIGICALLIGVMLFYGAATKRGSFVYPYIFVSIARIILGLILCIISAIYGHFWYIIVYFVANYFFSIYFTLVVYSFYEHITGHISGSNV